MVLPEANGPNEPQPFSIDPSQDQQAPPNDNDPYASDYNATVIDTTDPSHFQVAPGVYINYTKLPKPWLHSQETMQTSMKVMREHCRKYSEVLGREVRQDEAEAITYNWAKGLRTSYLGPPLGIALGVGLAYRAGMMKSVPSRINFDKFGPLNGNNARRAWRGVRYFSYASIGCICGAAVFTSYASSVAAVASFRDPRLKELNERLQQMAQEGRLKRELEGGLPGGRKVDDSPGPRGEETFDMARQRRNMQRMQQEARSKRGSNMDDASPTGGSFGEEFSEASNSGGNDLMSDSQLPTTQHSGRQADAAQRAPARRAGDESASPAARSDTTSKSGGSAWDRLREQANSGQGQASSRTSKASSNGMDGSSSLDSFAFSNADEEKQLARGEAQKQFDARMERERAGKDFDDRNGRGEWKS